MLASVIFSASNDFFIAIRKLIKVAEKAEICLNRVQFTSTSRTESKQFHSHKVHFSWIKNM